MSDVPNQEVNVNKPTIIKCQCIYNHTTKEYEVSLSVKQDDLVIESRDYVVHDNYMSAKLYIDNFFDKYKDATHES